MVADLLKLMRPKHWLKNGLIAAPLFFSFNFTVFAVTRNLLAILAFSLLASTIYIINDIADRESDRHHPIKKKRPIASGKVPVNLATTLAGSLLVGSLAMLASLGAKVIAIALFYLILNVAYSFYLKHLPIIDVMVVALGFVIRVAVGAFAIQVHLSHWILLGTFFIALFMAFGKRKHEMGLEDLGKHRRASAEYTDRFIDQMLGITAGMAVVFYSLYTISPDITARFGSEHLIYTTPIAVFGIFRYYYLLYNRNEGGDPVQLLVKDRQLIACLILWLASVAFIYVDGHQRIFG